jgi:heat shock protein HtpX
MKNQIKTIVLLGILTAILVWIGGFLGTGYLYLFTAIALLMNLGAYFYSDRIVLAVQGAKEVTPQQAPDLHRMVGELALQAQIPKPRIFVTNDPHANAFATGRNPKHGVVAVTTGILDVLNERELRGVLAHEIAHIKNRDILLSTIAAAIATAVTYLAHVLSYSALFGGGGQDGGRGTGGSGILFALVAPVAAVLVQLGISRSREYHADETGARISGDPDALAMALERLARSAERIPSHTEPAMASLFIVNPFAGTEGLQSLFSTHPPVRLRIRRLRELSNRIMRVPTKSAA